eukprot:TRINITY_DN3782_c0_g1_i7.p1 TRINITY_DN3782_c0_g1~~TRINITY_DN3782_c0_g1_i7.p1  ORF type:complete len:154 (+),score=50.95 TRINITY_DN3782_c0_g1_i7:361-822(+)
MLYVETSLVSETGLDTDEFLFLDEHEQRRNALLEQQRREMQDFNRTVSSLVHREEISYVEHLFQAKLKQKATKKRKVRPFIPVAPVVDSKKKKEEKSSNLETSVDEGPAERKSKNDEENDETESEGKCLMEGNPSRENDGDVVVRDGFSLVDY